MFWCTKRGRGGEKVQLRKNGDEDGWILLISSVWTTLLSSPFTSSSEPFLSPSIRHLLCSFATWRLTPSFPRPLHWPSPWAHLSALSPVPPGSNIWYAPLRYCHPLTHLSVRITDVSDNVLGFWHGWQSTALGDVRRLKGREDEINQTNKKRDEK